MIDPFCSLASRIASGIAAHNSPYQTHRRGPFVQTDITFPHRTSLHRTLLVRDEHASRPISGLTQPDSELTQPDSELTQPDS
eukprot:3122819-Rhodomonas_salina.2